MERSIVRNTQIYSCSVAIPVRRMGRVQCCICLAWPQTEQARSIPTNKKLPPSMEARSSELRLRRLQPALRYDTRLWLCKKRCYPEYLKLRASAAPHQGVTTAARRREEAAATNWAVAKRCKRPASPEYLRLMAANTFGVFPTQRLTEALAVRDALSAASAAMFDRSGKPEVLWSAWRELDYGSAGLRRLQERLNAVKRDGGGAILLDVLAPPSTVSTGPPSFTSRLLLQNNSLTIDIARSGHMAELLSALMAGFGGCVGSNRSNFVRVIDVGVGAADRVAPNGTLDPTRPRARMHVDLASGGAGLGNDRMNPCDPLLGGQFLWADPHSVAPLLSMHDGAVPLVVHERGDVTLVTIPCILELVPRTHPARIVLEPLNTEPVEDWLHVVPHLPCDHSLRGQTMLQILQQCPCAVGEGHGKVCLSHS